VVSTREAPDGVTDEMVEAGWTAYSQRMFHDGDQAEALGAALAAVAPLIRARAKQEIIDKYERFQVGPAAEPQDAERCALWNAGYYQGHKQGTKEGRAQALEEAKDAIDAIENPPDVFSALNLAHAAVRALATKGKP
jgi:hypothetical protein